MLRTVLFLTTPFYGAEAVTDFEFEVTDAVLLHETFSVLTPFVVWNLCILLNLKGLFLHEVDDTFVYFILKFWKLVRHLLLLFLLDGKVVVLITFGRHGWFLRRCCNWSPGWGTNSPLSLWTLRRCPFLAHGYILLTYNVQLGSVWFSRCNSHRFVVRCKLAVLFSLHYFCDRFVLIF